MLQKEDLEMMKRTKNKYSGSMIGLNATISEKLSQEQINNRSHSFGPESTELYRAQQRLDELEKDLDPEKLLMVKQVSDGYQTKHKMILRDITLASQEETKSNQQFNNNPYQQQEKNQLELVNDKDKQEMIQMFKNLGKDINDIDSDDSSLLDDLPLQAIGFQELKKHQKRKNKTIIDRPKKQFLEDIENQRKPTQLKKVIEEDVDHNNDQLNVAQKMIKLDLLLMGFNLQTVYNLLKYEDVQDTNQGVDLLIKGPNGYTHKYQLDIFSQRCMICQELGIEHQDEKIRLSEMKLQLLQDTNRFNRPQLTEELIRTNILVRNPNERRSSARVQNLIANLPDLRIERISYVPAPSQPQQKAVPIDVGGVMCEICYMNYMESDMYGIKCEHKFCLNCLHDYLEFNITNGQVVKIKCAQNECREEFTREDIRKFGSQEIYMKYLKFKENIDVNLNPNLKWCPRPNCNHYVQKNKGKSKKVKCECGMEICFDCGTEWHGKVKCQDAMDKDFFGWAANNGNISNCPKCKVRLEKISGCNHMTCRQCGYSWCWLCGKKYNSYHYSIINVFGCPGQQYFTYHRVWVILLNILIFAAIPIIIVFAPPIYLISQYFNTYDDGCLTKILCCTQCVDRNCSSCWCHILVAIIFLPIVFSIGLVVGAIALAVLILPAYLFQLYRILKLIFYRCWCCLK